MAQYVYKDFHINYDIEFSAFLNIYKAHGRIGFTDKGHDFFQEFSTQAPSSDEAEQEIKKLIHQYIDFEWKQYLLQ